MMVVKTLFSGSMFAVFHTMAAGRFSPSWNGKFRFIKVHKPSSVTNSAMVELD